ncbi:uncharacterized protein [Littorina saxatilis]|uniref:uncharacterized protein isoform X2 n=1 Tax=Littorina saxatilis TaxID=31220 RepID=UPI0038B5EA98
MTLPPHMLSAPGSVGRLAVNVVLRTGRLSLKLKTRTFIVLIVITVSLITLQSWYLSRWWPILGNEQAQLVQSWGKGEAKERNDITSKKVEKNKAKEGSARAVLQTDDDTIENLAVILNKKLSDFPSEKGGPTKKLCDRAKSGSAPCVNTTCPARFSSSPETRLKQILSTRNESLHSFKSAMAEVTRDVSASNKYVLVSAASANHYHEMQAMVKDVHTHLFPRLTNFTFIIFDLGLSPLQRNLTEKNCGCTVLDFPFDKLPAFFSILRCYTWKPMIIRSLIEKTEFLVWMDSSVRWNRTAKSLDSLFQRCKERGLQMWFGSVGSVAVRTQHDMFSFYGDQPCQYDPFGELHASYGVYHNEPFVRYAVLDPWLSCAFTRRCMCQQNAKRSCSGKLVPRRTGVCHRFDQSSLGIILIKLYGGRMKLINMNTQMEVRRRDKAEWFTK